MTLNDHKYLVLSTHVKAISRARQLLVKKLAIVVSMLWLPFSPTSLSITVGWMPSVSMLRHCNRLPRETGNAPSLEAFKAALDGALSSLV